MPRGRPPVYDWDGYAMELFDLLTATPDGLDRYQIEERLALVHSYHVNQVIHRLRRVLGEGDTINVVHRKEGWRTVYFLSGDLDGTTPWTRTMCRDQLTRLETMSAVWRSIVTGSDGRTVEGRIARHILKWIDRLVEDVQDELTTSFEEAS